MNMRSKCFVSAEVIFSPILVLLFKRGQLHKVGCSQRFDFHFHKLSRYIFISYIIY